MPTNTYTALATMTLGGSDSEIIFSSIPSTYRDLIIVLTGTSSAITNWRVRFNSDSNANYSFVAMAGNGSGSGAPGAYGGEVFGTVVWQNYGAVTSLTQVRIHVMDYAVGKHKVFLARTDNPNGATEAFSNRWASNAPITDISLFPQGTNWASGTVVSLYGVAA